MIKAIIGVWLTAFLLGAFCISCELNDLYTKYIEHEKKREENIHLAYSNILNKLENVKQATIALPPSAVMPEETVKPMALPQVGKGKK